MNNVFNKDNELENVPAQTSVPDWLMTYCRQLANVHFQRKLNRMYVHMLEGFLATKPWLSTPPLPWRIAKIHGSSGLRSRNGTDMGWVPMNMTMPLSVNNRIKAAIEVINENLADSERRLSLRTFLFTAVYWWCTYVYPYEGPGMIEG